MNPIIGYRVTYKGLAVTVNAFTPNAAKYSVFKRFHEYDLELKYKDMRCRKLPGPVDAGTRSTAQYRGVPFVKPGMLCRLGDRLGRIVSGGHGGQYFGFATPEGYSCVFHPQGDRVEWLNEDETPLDPTQEAARPHQRPQSKSSS
jgi:hypothetical protein